MMKITVAVRNIQEDVFVPEFFSSVSIAWATTSRGARLFMGWYLSMKGVPFFSFRIAPSPRTASLIRNALASGWVPAGSDEMDEFHVGNACPGPVGHGHAIAGGDIGVRSDEVDLSRAARGEDHEPGAERVNLAAQDVQDVGGRGSGRCR